MFGYRVPTPDEAMLISGAKIKAGGPFLVIVGHGKFVGPMKRVRFLTLAMQESLVQEPCTTKQGIPLMVKAVVAFKVGNDPESIVNAGQRFLSDQSQMTKLAGQIFAGHLRSIVGSMTVEEIITDRQKLATEVLDGSKAEMAKMGLIVDSLQIQSIDDGNSGYIQAMSAPHQAAIQRQAKIAQAEANQEAEKAVQASAQQQVVYQQQTTIAKANADADIAAAEQEAERRKVIANQETTIAKATADADIATAQQEAERRKVTANRETSVVSAQAKADVDKAQAAAAQAGPLATAQAQADVLDAQAALAEKNTDLRQKQLQAEVVKPAEAEAEKVLALARANAERTRLEADALAASSRVTLDNRLIDQLPALVKEAASGLQGANVNILNGADGLGEIVTGFVSQGLTILDAARKFRSDTGWNLPDTSTDGKVTTRAKTPVK